MTYNYIFSDDAVSGQCVKALINMHLYSRIRPAVMQNLPLSIP